MCKKSIKADILGKKYTAVPVLTVNADIYTEMSPKRRYPIATSFPKKYFSVTDNSVTDDDTAATGCDDTSKMEGIMQVNNHLANPSN